MTTQRSIRKQDAPLRTSLGLTAWNYTKTTLLLAGLTALFGAIGYAIGGPGWAVGALVIAGLMNFGAYWFSDKMVLRMHHAEPVSRADSPRLFSLVERLADRAGLPMPALYIIRDDSPNAFATGRNPRNAAVAVTTGLLELMKPSELEGVIAHELAHIKNRDMLIMTVAGAISGAISMIAQILGFSMLFGGRDSEEGGGGISALLMIILAPIMAMLIQMSISRGREYEADRVGAQIAGNPRGLADALDRLAWAQERVPTRTSPATAHLFIMQPLSAEGMASMFSTHPPIGERVRRLRSL
ncbi:MAG: zinc metalloprotease HtpX [Polyangia bacterium]|jgi:heat shock protein HtpX|nr:zinc metalloprotease HtpX [Polyangia bacterium]